MHRPPAHTPVRPTLQSLEDRVLLSAYHVTNVNDAGLGYLRQAILDSNANPGLDTIDFSIGTGPATITPLSQLPKMTDAVILDGTTEPGYAGKPIIEVSGASSGTNSVDGLLLAGGNSTLRGLVVNRWSGSGVIFSGSGNDVAENNYIGTDITGQIHPNLIHGLILSVINNNRVGGTTAAQRNVISGNGGAGLFFFNANNNTVQGNYMGLAADGVTALANSVGTFVLGSTGNLVGGTGTGTGNVISGNNSDGLLIYADSSQNTVQGNRIGTDYSGTLAAGNGNWGIELQGFNNLIGGTATGSMNLLSGNKFDGLVFYLGASQFNKVQGNYIGTDITGTKALGNGDAGVSFSGDTDVNLNARGPINNLLGGTDPLERNIISGNGQTGVGIFNRTSFNNIEGNYIGLDVAGTKAIPNFIGVDAFDDSTHNTFGGTDPGAGNVISGNNFNGALIGSDYTTFQGNIIGLDPTGAFAIPNKGDGIDTTKSSHNTIGGTLVAARNIISGNSGSAVHLEVGGSNVVQNNYLGTLPNGVSSAPNGTGVYVDGSDGNVISNNLITANLNNGIDIRAGVGNRFTANSIYANGGLGIDFLGNGVTPNTPGGPHAGPNELQNYPVLTTAQTDGTASIISGTLNSTPMATFTIDFYASPLADASGYGEGKTYLGSKTVTADANGNVSFTATVNLAAAAVGQVVSATAASADGSTSEFSADVTLTAAPAPAVTANGFAYLTSPHRVTFTFTQNVAASIDLGDVVIRPLLSGGDVAPVSYAYDPLTNTVSFALPALADGNYQAILRSAGVSNANGAKLAADVSFGFFELRGDANHDRTVDFNDLVALAQNYNVVGGRTWADGDFTGDGNVDFNDLVFLAQNYNTTLTPAAAAAPADMPAPVVSVAAAAPVTTAAPVVSIGAPAPAATPAPVVSVAAPVPALVRVPVTSVVSPVAAATPAPIVSAAVVTPNFVPPPLSPQAKRAKPAPVFSVEPVVKPVPAKVKPKGRSERR